MARQDRNAPSTDADRRTTDDASAEEHSSTSAPTSETEPVRDYRGTGVVWGGILVLLLAIGLIIVAFQNSQEVEFDFLWIDTTAPLVLILAITVAAAIVIDEIVGSVWRRRRRSRLRDREELKRLRSQQGAVRPTNRRRNGWGRWR